MGYYARNRVTRLWSQPRFRMQPEFTNHCNFKCRLCPHSTYRKPSAGGNRFDREKGYMSNEVFDLFLANAEKYATTVLIGFFGEQLLHPKFEEFVRVFPKRKPYELVLFSNWSLVTRKNMETLKLFDNVRISIDASNSDLWEQLCPSGAVLDLDGAPGKNRYETLVEKIEYWLGLPDHPLTRLKYVVSSVNEGDREVFLKEWLPKMGPNDGVAMKSVISYGGVMRDSYMQENPCTVYNEYRMTVAWNGDCSPCNLDVNMDLCVGNLIETRDIGKMVKQDRYKQVRDGMRRKAGICANCFDANNHTESMEYPGEKSLSQG